MTNSPLKTDTLICANSKDGFVTHQKQLMNSSYLYIIKGGPGTGKSSFMKTVAKSYLDKGFTVECIHCSSDTNSLDGVYIKDKKILFFDGTSPHSQELITPGAGGEIIDLGAFWDSLALEKSLDTIRKLNEDMKLAYQKAYSILKVAGELELAKDNICNSFLLENKLQKYLSSFCKRLFKKTATKGSLNIRFSNSISHNGITDFLPNATTLANDIYEISDSYSYILPLMLDVITDFAIKNGYTVTAFCTALNPLKKEFIVVDELKIGIGKMTTNPYMRINTSRFTDTVNFKSSKNRVNLYKKLMSELIDDAIFYLKKAFSFHDDLENIYKKEMNFTAVTDFTKVFLAKL
ncbi:MAG: hypothetical protein RR088_03540 [Clostridia bacterium]